MVLIVLIVTIVLLGNTDIAEAQSVDDLVSVVQDELIFDQVIQQNLVNNSVADCEYLYNLDNSADHLYVTLNGGGYAIFNWSVETTSHSPQWAEGVRRRVCFRRGVHSCSAGRRAAKASC